MRVTAGAAAGATVGVIAAALAQAAYPAQVVLSTAAGVAYLVLLTELRTRKKADASDWLVVQLLLAANLAAFALGPVRHIGWAATAALLASAIGLTVVALRLRFGRHHRR